jgi:hypothetical protein
MGHYCRICGGERPNEQFSGKGRKIHVCKRCQAKPKAERRAIEDQDEIFRFLKQSHISEKNVTRLGRMAKSDNPQVASLADLRSHETPTGGIGRSTARPAAAKYIGNQVDCGAETTKCCAND